MAVDISTKGMHRYMNNRDLVVMFHAPWCGHCQKMKPAFAEAAEALKISHPHVSLVRYNADKHRQDLAGLPEDFGKNIADIVEGYPTIIFFKAGGKASVYKGARDAPSLQSAVERYF